MEKNNFNFEKRVFLVKVVDRSICTRYEDFLISYVKLDHAMYLIN